MWKVSCSNTGMQAFSKQLQLYGQHGRSIMTSRHLCHINFKNWGLPRAEVVSIPATGLLGKSFRVIIKKVLLLMLFFRVGSDEICFQVTINQLQVPIHQ